MLHLFSKSFRSWLVFVGTLERRSFGSKFVSGAFYYVEELISPCTYLGTLHFLLYAQLHGTCRALVSIRVQRIFPVNSWSSFAENFYYSNHGSVLIL